MFKAKILETEKQLDILANSYAKLNEPLRTSLSNEASNILKTEYIDNNKWSGVINISICDLRSDQGIVLHLRQGEQLESATNPIPDFWEVKREGLTYLVPINKKFCGPILTRLYDTRPFESAHKTNPNNVKETSLQFDNPSDQNIFLGLQDLYERMQTGDKANTAENYLVSAAKSEPNPTTMVTRSYNSPKKTLS